MFSRLSTMVNTCQRLTIVLGGDSLISRAPFFLKLMTIPLRKRLFGRRPVALHVRFRGADRIVHVRDGADIAVMHEIFVEEEYALNENRSPASIVDIGGHIGFASLYFSIIYPSAQIRTYEPDPENFAVLLLNTKNVPAITAYQAAVSSTTGTVHFFAGTSSISSSLIKREDSREIAVEAVTLDGILSQHPADLVKFDVEGAEFDLFAASSRRSECAHYIGEMHYDLIGRSREEFLDLFPKHVISEQEIAPKRAILEMRVPAKKD